MYHSDWVVVEDVRVVLVVDKEGISVGDAVVMEAVGVKCLLLDHSFFLLWRVIITFVKN